MKKLAIFVLVLISIISTTISAPAAQLTDAQLDQSLNDRLVMHRYLRCALGEGPCDASGRRLRSLAPLVLRGACPQCSPAETRQIQRTLSFIQRNYPWEWTKIIRQYG